MAIDNWMDVARRVAVQTNCSRRQVGVLLLPYEEDISYGACNGTPEGMTRCDDGGCPRCAGNVKSLTHYDSCLCIHAEQWALGGAASVGVNTTDATVYSTLQPCLTCLKQLVVARVGLIVYDEDIPFVDDDSRLAWERMAKQTNVLKHNPDLPVRPPGVWKNLDFETLDFKDEWRED